MTQVSSPALTPADPGFIQRAGVRLAQVAAEYPLTSVYVTGLVTMFAVLVAIALARPRTFAATVVTAATAQGFSRRSVLSAVVVMWSVAWPVTTLVILAVLTMRVGRR